MKVAETTGAGDGFVAALVSGLPAHVRKLEEVAEIPPERLAEICDFANAVGALTCTKVGAIPALPTRAAALRFWNARRTTPAR